MPIWLQAHLLYQHEQFYRYISLQASHHSFAIVNDRKKAIFQQMKHPWVWQDKGMKLSHFSLQLKWPIFDIMK